MSEKKSRYLFILLLIKWSKVIKIKKDIVIKFDILQVAQLI